MSTQSAGTLESPVKQALKRGVTTLENVLGQLRNRDVASLQSTANEATFLLEAARLAVESGYGTSDPAEREFHAARLRGLARVAELRKLAEPCLDCGAVCELLGVSRETIRKKLERNQLLALPKGSEDRVFPALQFERGAVIPGIAEVLDSLATDPFIALSFLLGKNESFGGITALEALKEGRVDEVLAEASTLLEHGS
jgi:hypothetical protein